MGAEFRSPKSEGDSKQGLSEKTVFKPLDQTLITAVMIILIALLSWMAYTTQNLAVNFAQFSAKYEVSEQKRDLSLIYIDRRLENLEKNFEKLKNGKTD